MNSRKFFHDSVEELPELESVSGGLKVNAAFPEHLEEVLPVHFALGISDAAQSELEGRVARGETVSAAELNSKYGVAAGQVEPLVAWLKKEGFDVTQVAPDGTSVFARASAGTIQKALQVHFVRVTGGGYTNTAVRDVPSLPADVGGPVVAISGLQPYRRAHKRSVRVGQHRLRRSASVAGAPQPAPAVANQPPYLVSEILRAYNGSQLSLTGKGQTIAILIDTFPLDSDLQAFWQRNQLHTQIGQIQKVNVAGGSLPAPEGEETLDASWTSGIAPDATIRIYATGSLDFAALDRALDKIITDVATIPGMRQLSISLGLGETFVPAGEIKAQSQKYLRLAALGVNVFVSSGDAGSNPDSSGHGGQGPLQVEYAASDPSVVGVGGTSLVLDAAGGVSRETGWPDGGGGKSRKFKRPTWQKAPGAPTGPHRLVPDVSAVADPNTGALLILNGQETQIGGTSWSAPQWAGFCALINEARSKAGKSALGFLNPLLYPLGGHPAFRDIVSGNNGAYSASPGFDLVTGLGVPDLAALVQALS